MKYYRITYSFEKNEVGHYPQVQNISWAGMPYEDGAFCNQGYFNPVFDNPAIPTLEFYKSAKITSLIDVVTITDSIYLVISEALLNFLKSKFQGAFQTWKISAKHKESIYDYHIFFLNNPKNDFIDYEKSIFRFYTKGVDRKRVKLNEDAVMVLNDQDCMDKYRQYPPVGINKPFFEAEKLVVNGNNLDFFRSSSPTIAGYYVSENLKNEIEKQGFTGIRFLELDEINNFVKIETL